ncbi:MAG: RTX toxin, partial [Myxococcales bacterium]|nr:RTX toxin [Myxococcales bacterium]
LWGGRARCWGLNTNGQLGQGNTNSFGNDKLAYEAALLPVTGEIVQIAAGAAHTCVLLATGRVQCWGRGQYGALGYGDTRDVGRDQQTKTAGNVLIGGFARDLAAGQDHTCVVLDDGSVRCWGIGEPAATTAAHLGNPANTATIGDDEVPEATAPVVTGAEAAHVYCGARHTCILTPVGKVRCWGMGGFGRLGYGNTDTIGDDEDPAAAGDVDVGDTVTALALGAEHTCALLWDGRVRCWGRALDGRLGYGDGLDVGDDETPADKGDVPLLGSAIAIAAGVDHTCALLRTGAVQCWGSGANGKLGYGNTLNVGDTPEYLALEAGTVDLGDDAVWVALGAADGDHTCALLASGGLRCWGRGKDGALGLGNSRSIGDDEVPAAVDEVQYQ